MTFNGLLRSALAAFVVALASSPVSAAQHAFGDFQIHIADDGNDAASASDYQITVENQELLLTRLSASYEGRLSNSFVADLNQDGAFEVVVTFTYAGGDKTDIHLYTFDEHLLKPLKVARLDASQSVGYRGADQFAVADGKLVRIYQLYEQADGEWTPTAQQRRLRYSLDEGRWLSE